jgi:RHS repeat-associated protein
MSGGANNSRLVSMTYPNGRAIDYNYNAGLDDRISRLSSISDSSGTLESYKYLGLGTVVERDHPQPGVNLTYIGTGTGDAGDQYTGLDRFGRVVDQLWTTGSTTKDEFTYTYDRDSNALTKTNTQHSALNETYAYDNLNRLTSFSQGTHTQGYALDGAGNFSSVTTDGTQVHRTMNAQNQITLVGGSSLAYDSNGNLTTDDHGQTLIYDAWNRLIQVKNGSTVLDTFAYDALDRRVTATVGSTTTHLYYSTAGQVLEERIGSATGATVQYVWCPCYVGALVERDRDPTGGTSLTERLYVAQDANYNVTALIDTSGNVQERFAYDPYGKTTIYDASWNVRSVSSYGWQYTFQGLRFEDAVGLFDNSGRWYSPTLQTFVSQDPLGFGGGQTNLYERTADQPVNGRDPSGADPLALQGMGPQPAPTPGYPVFEQVPAAARYAAGVYLYKRPIDTDPQWLGDLFDHTLGPSHQVLVVRHSDGSFDTYGFDGTWVRNSSLDTSRVNKDFINLVGMRFVEYYQHGRYGIDIPWEYIQRAYEVLYRAESDKDLYNTVTYNCWDALTRLLHIARTMYFLDRPDAQKVPPALFLADVKNRQLQGVAKDALKLVEQFPELQNARVSVGRGVDPNKLSVLQVGIDPRNVYARLGIQAP